MLFFLANAWILGIIVSDIGSLSGTKAGKEKEVGIGKAKGQAKVIK
jgi:hypothetical protein